MKLPVVDNANGLSAKVNSLTPPEIVAWAMDRFQAWRIAITTSFGMDGCALIDMIARTGHPVRILYLDTHFFFPETYDLRNRLIRRYPHLVFINEGTTLTPAEQEKIHGEKLWERDPDLCCRIRKIEPMQRVLSRDDVWITAIRREQSEVRATVKVIEWDWRFDVLKIAPMANWTKLDVLQYVREHNVPYNPLHEKGYPSIGCTHCTAPVEGATLETVSREGRWNGTGKTECGLHLREEEMQ